MKPVWPGAPRHAPDMEFPPYAFVPGVQPHPERDPAGHSYGRECGPARFEEGIDLYHAGYLWEAHEVWERSWKGTKDGRERDFYQGLIQMAAGALKLRMGQPEGAARLIALARERLARAVGMHGVDLAALLAALDRWAGRMRWEDLPRLRIAAG